MKKLKVLRGVLIGVFVVAAACCIFTACSSDKDSTDNTPITDMTLSVDNVKRTYLTYQSFSSDGIEATVKHESGNSEAIVANDLVVDYSAFDNSTAGEYDIVVSYTENGVTLSDTYKVEVIEEITGLAVEKETIDYTLTSTAGVNINVDDVKVYAVDGNGQSSTALSTGSYELKYYKDGKEISSLNGVSGGIYTIYAYMNVTVVGKYSTIDYECGGYVLCYVYDTPTKIELGSSSSAVYSQEASSKDVMSSTWTFIVTYESGLTKTVTGTDVEISGLVTTVVGESRTATVTYSENCKTSTTKELVSVSINVTYTISGISDDLYGSKTIYNFNDMDYNSDFSGGETIFDMFSVVGGVKVGSNSTNWNDMPEELEGLTINKRVQLTSSNYLTFSMLLPGTVTVYGYYSSTGSLSLNLTGSNSEDVYVVGEEGAEASVKERTGNWEDNCVKWHCVAGNYTLKPTASSLNLWVIVIEYEGKEETAGAEPTSLSPFETLSLENIDLSLPENSAASFGVDNSKKN